ncbi:alpha,alpha-trehalase TreA [Runella slithyformis]|uniref:Alpha,alpha-trehalase n=1 Tax=Runella slithyformis (strain ATCC 29530 / DSM 19594 / LMG 11500 / NCIMB 11436 / LSU 4) TaxID=761193 RepID=A0A7U3ZR74_RUNSL|nr:alpha,alpha-trehalase TreA [Runella slithyformis]AEI51872.1 Alpha,alpha-trehalase [Runella slithyformis DSM 19594]
MTLPETKKLHFIQDEDVQLLYNDVQHSNLFSDSKTFSDAIAKYPPAQIAEAYHGRKNQSGFVLKHFINENFILPTEENAYIQSDLTKPIERHLEDLWEVLTRQPEKAENTGTLISLPFKYVVPGGRFREIYYWDSYFTMLGLQVSGRGELVESMVNNFAYLIDTVGFIPNGNRTYYLGRSQPPFFALMVSLLAEQKGECIWLRYLPQLEKEYAFWMRGEDNLSLRGTETKSTGRVVMLPDGSVLNRYWDDIALPRPEAYKEDVALAAQISDQAPADVYRHLRAAAESGWDFSSRWFKDGQSMTSIHTTDILPVDLNCLLWYLEKSLAQAYELQGDSGSASVYDRKAMQRRAAIQNYCWNEAQGFYFDYDRTLNQPKNGYTLAAVFPLFFSLATDAQAAKVAGILEERFLRKSGLLTTLQFTHEQWDAPNGWAPLQWIAYQGLKNYRFDDLAGRVKERWMNNNEIYYAKTGKMMEKYNVLTEDVSAQDGEYPNQDGFGWTNGVYLKMKES